MTRRKRPQRTNVHAVGVDVAVGSVSVDEDVAPIGQRGASAQVERSTPPPPGDHPDGRFRYRRPAPYGQQRCGHPDGV